MNFNLWKNFIVNEKAKGSLLKIYQRNSYPPALIFFGQKGVGKEAHAFAFAQSINCIEKKFEPCGKCIRCNAVFNFMYPDVHYVFATPGSTEKSKLIKKIESTLEKKKLTPTLRSNSHVQTK